MENHPDPALKGLCASLDNTRVLYNSAHGLYGTVEPIRKTMNDSDGLVRTGEENADVSPQYQEEEKAKFG